MNATETPKTYTATIAPHAAAPGLLAGFTATCSCGWTIGYSSRVLTEEAVREHYDWHAGRGVFAAKKRRK